MTKSRDTAAPHNDTLMDGPWLSNQTAASLPDIQREFDLNRDPLIRQQHRDLEKTEAQRRGEGAGRASGMVERDKPNPAQRPPLEISQPVDRAAFSSRWLVEQRDAVLANAAARQRPANETPVRSRGLDAPSR